MSGGVRVGAMDEVRTELEGDINQGGLEVLAEGTTILQEIPAPETSTKENGDMGDGRTRGEKGYRSRSKGGKQQWDPGSS